MNIVHVPAVISLLSVIYFTARSRAKRSSHLGWNALCTRRMHVSVIS